MIPFSQSRKNSVAVAVSGGVDSLCAMLLLKEAGYSVIALHGLFLPENAPSPVYLSLANICNRLAIPLVIAPLQKIFQEKIMTRFARDWAHGLVPNPCTICNRIIKFGALKAAARRTGATFFATGHYARLMPENDGLVLARAADLEKDQSYFLALCHPAQFANVLFPLGDLRKKDCRSIVASYGLEIPEPRESQDICFIPNGDYRSFLRDFWQKNGSLPPHGGPIYERCENGCLRLAGTHDGLWNYTPGQRKGLGVQSPVPLHVLAKDTMANALIVGKREMIAMRSCMAGDIKTHMPVDQWPAETFARLRHNGHLLPAKAGIISNELHISLLQPNWPAAPGQTAAIYDNAGHLLCGGIIENIS